VVDDEPDARGVNQACTSEGCNAEVVTAASAQEALQALSRDKPHVSDIEPQEDGYLLIRKLRALPPEQGGRIPAVWHARERKIKRALCPATDAYLKAC